MTPAITQEGGVIQHPNHLKDVSGLAHPVGGNKKLQLSQTLEQGDSKRLSQHVKQQHGGPLQKKYSVALRKPQSFTVDSYLRIVSESKSDSTSPTSDRGSTSRTLSKRG